MELKFIDSAADKVAAKNFRECPKSRRLEKWKKAGATKNKHDFELFRNVLSILLTHSLIPFLINFPRVDFKLSHSAIIVQA